LAGSVLNAIARRGLLSFALVIAGVGLAFALAGPVLQTLAPATEQRVRPIAPPAQPSARLTFEQIVYEGAFRLPGGGEGDTFSFGGRPLAFNPVANTLFVGARSGKVAELAIPTPVKATSPEELPFAHFVQPFHDPADGRIRDVAAEGASLDGLLVHAGRLYGTGLIYYDATHSQQLTHFTRSLNLGRAEVTRMHRVGEPGQAGFVAGYMASVPQEWQAALGGAAVTGQCCIPIAGRTSWGPSLFSWNPSQLGRGAATGATPLLYYNSEHPTLGPWEGSNPTYGGTTEMAGVAVIDGTRTALFVGRNGTGPFCYGDGVADQSTARGRGHEGQRYCYDPVNADKGPHAYPYRLQFWAYDLGDLAAVRAGSKDPWEVVPYAVWPFDLPIHEPRRRVGSVAYDAATRRLFISQLNGDRDGYEFRPLIHVFRIS
jgi:hypothetical protein